MEADKIVRNWCLCMVTWQCCAHFGLFYPSVDCAAVSVCLSATLWMLVYSCPAVGVR